MGNELKEKDDTVRKRIGNRLKELRTKNGISLIQLSEVTGLTPSNIARIEDGRYTAKLEVLQSIATALGCVIDVVPV